MADERSPSPHGVGVSEVPVPQVARSEVPRSGVPVAEIAVEDRFAVSLKAPAKLTLTLRITGTRPDGYHEIDAEMITLDLYDELELTAADETTIELIGATDDVPTGPENLVCKALDHVGLNARVQLRKNIPSRAGLGGGSADAAAVLRWAGVTDPLDVVSLGSDIAFCLIGGRARVSGGWRANRAASVRRSCGDAPPPADRVLDRRGVRRLGPAGRTDRAWRERPRPSSSRSRSRPRRVAGRAPQRHRTGTTARGKRVDVVRARRLPG